MCFFKDKNLKFCTYSEEGPVHTSTSPWCLTLITNGIQTSKLFKQFKHCANHNAKYTATQMYES